MSLHAVMVITGRTVPLLVTSGLLLIVQKKEILSFTYRFPQDLRSLFWDLIPELILSQNAIHTWVQFATFQEL
jgi:hypothetical protein